MSLLVQQVNQIGNAAIIFIYYTHLETVMLFVTRAQNIFERRMQCDVRLGRRAMQEQDTYEQLQIDFSPKSQFQVLNLLSFTGMEIFVRFGLENDHN